MKLACPGCRKRTENYILDEKETVVTVRCMKCGKIYDHDKTSQDPSDVLDDAPDLPCYG